MSGFVALFHSDGAPVERPQLEALAGALRIRGAGDRGLWLEREAGLAVVHASGRGEAGGAGHPLSLDGTTWLVADARIDGRAELTAQLAACGEQARTDASDGELVLRAYRAWGAACVEHLIGDFGFVLWDGERRTLLAARDHFGVKPLYYAQAGPTVLVSNTLDGVRRHARVSARLNDQAVADFLLDGLNADPSTTFFADVHRVPPAHVGIWSREGFRLQRYWTLTEPEPLHLPHADDYVSEFRRLLRETVSDRVRGRRVAVMMSGGLDSTTLAATAHRLLGGRGQDGVRAFTTSFEGFDEERTYAGMVATSLGFGIEYEGWEDDRPEREWWATPTYTPEPRLCPNAIRQGQAMLARVAEHAGVMLYGEGPDNVLQYEWQPYLRHLLRTRQHGRWLRAVASDVWLQPRLPFRWTLRHARRDETHPRGEPRPQRWLNPDFVSRAGLAAERRPEMPHAASRLRVRSLASLQRPLWQAMFESFDPAQTRVPLDVRHPFMDVRMIQFLLAVPAVPWARSKLLIRQAMAGTLPRAVLRRPKSPLRRDPWPAYVRSLGLPPLDAAPELSAYVNIEWLRRASAAPGPEYWTAFRAHALDYWLKGLAFAGA